MSLTTPAARAGILRIRIPRAGDRVPHLPKHSLTRFKCRARVIRAWLCINPLSCGIALWIPDCAHTQLTESMLF